MSSALQFAQRRTVDVHRVAVMPHATEQRVHHRLIAEKVVPLVIDQIRCNDCRVPVIAFLHQLEESVHCSGLRFKYPNSSTSKTSRRARRLSNLRVDRSASDAYISSNRSCARMNWQR